MSARDFNRSCAELGYFPSSCCKDVTSLAVTALTDSSLWGWNAGKALYNHLLIHSPLFKDKQDYKTGKNVKQKSWNGKSPYIFTVIISSTDVVVQHMQPYCLFCALKTEPKPDVALILHTEEHQLSKQHRVCLPAYSCI